MYVWQFSSEADLDWVVARQRRDDHWLESKDNEREEAERSRDQPAMPLDHESR